MDELSRQLDHLNRSVEKLIAKTSIGLKQLKQIAGGVPGAGVGVGQGVPTGMREPTFNGAPYVRRANLLGYAGGWAGAVAGTAAAFGAAALSLVPDPMAQVERQRNAYMLSQRNMGQFSSAQLREIAKRQLGNNFANTQSDMEALAAGAATGLSNRQMLARGSTGKSMVTLAGEQFAAFGMDPSKAMSGIGNLYNSQTSNMMFMMGAPVTSLRTGKLRDPVEMVNIIARRANLQNYSEDHLESSMARGMLNQALSSMDPNTRAVVENLLRLKRADLQKNGAKSMNSTKWAQGKVGEQGTVNDPNSSSGAYARSLTDAQDTLMPGALQGYDKALAGITAAQKSFNAIAEDLGAAAQAAQALNTAWATLSQTAGGPQMAAALAYGAGSLGSAAVNSLALGRSTKAYKAALRGMGEAGGVHAGSSGGGGGLSGLFGGGGGKHAAGLSKFAKFAKFAKFGGPLALLATMAQIASDPSDIGGAVGSGLGGWGGAAAGAALGSFAGPIGTVVGGIIGGVGGSFFGDWLMGNDDSGAAPQDPTVGDGVPEGLGGDEPGGWGGGPTNNKSGSSAVGSGGKTEVGKGTPPEIKGLPKNVTRWASTVRTVLSDLSIPEKYLYGILRQIKQESGGNPKAVNNWDSNAKRGDPSVGLLQVIGSTYKAYAKDGYEDPKYRTEPYYNIYAALRYAKSRYGMSKFDKWNAGHNEGYASGAWRIGEDQVAKIHEGEMIIPAAVAAGVRDAISRRKTGLSSGGKTVNISVNAQGSSMADAVRLARMVKEILEDDDRYESLSRT